MTSGLHRNHPVLFLRRVLGESLAVSHPLQSKPASGFRVRGFNSGNKQGQWACLATLPRLSEPRAHAAHRQGGRIPLAAGRRAAAQSVASVFPLGRPLGPSLGRGSGGGRSQMAWEAASRAQPSPGRTVLTGNEHGRNSAIPFQWECQIRPLYVFSKSKDAPKMHT